MAKRKLKKNTGSKAIDLAVGELATASSPAHPATVDEVEVIATTTRSDVEMHLEGRSPVFKELALPKLPVLERQYRARLQVQSPNRVFFYWSLKGDPARALRQALSGETAGYTLVLRLVDLDTDREEILPIDFEGTHWFNTEADRKYRVEIGFYSTTKPFVRILYSNSVTTPRKSPSPRVATDKDWRVGAHKFAEVLDVSGFAKDAFDVAIAGDEPEAAAYITRNAFREFIGSDAVELEGISADELRHAMLVIASGYALEELRWKVGAALFAILQGNAARLAADKASAILHDHFDIDVVEFEEDVTGSGVFGVSLLNFPKRSKTRTRREYSPVSSHSSAVSRKH